MSDEEIQNDAGAATTPRQGEPEKAVPYERFKAVNSRMRELEAQVQRAEAERQAQQEKELAEQKRYQELADKYKADLERERQGRLQLETATRHGLPLEFAERLKGATPEEMAADAQALAAYLKPSAPPGGLPRNNAAPETGPTAAQLNDPAWIRANAAKLWPTSK